MKKIIYLVIGVLGIVSCNKETISNEPPYIEQWWDEYYGTYTVFDTLNDVTYEMEINQIERYFDGVLTSDSMSIKNIGDQFEVKIKNTQNIIYWNFLSFGVIQPLHDKNGYRWSFNGSLSEKENSDTLNLRYTISNIAYYMEDGVPYYACECVDLALKNE